MQRDELVRLASVADAVRASHTKRVNIDQWQPPRHAHLLKSPTAFVDQIVQELGDDGRRGDSLPWAKCETAFRLRPGELTVWGGSNGSMKSTLLSEIMLCLATSGKRVVVMSLEMPAYKVAAKMAAQALANPHPARHAIELWADRLAEDLSFLDMTGDLKPDETVKLTQYCAHELQAQHVLIDNLTKIISADNDHADDQRKFVAQLHAAAIGTGIHIHLVAHTRKPSNDESAPPGRYDIAGSRTLSDQPDNLVMVWRNRVKERKRAEGALGELDNSEQGDVVLNVDKQRHGRFEGYIRLWTDRHCWRFMGEPNQSALPYVGH